MLSDSHCRRYYCIFSGCVCICPKFFKSNISIYVHLDRHAGKLQLEWLVEVNNHKKVILIHLWSFNAWCSVTGDGPLELSYISTHTGVARDTKIRTKEASN